MSAEILEQEETLDQNELTSIPKDTGKLSPTELADDLSGTEATKTPYPSSDDDLPEKYRNKSAKEIAQMHIEAEKLIGKQSGEVGELRQFVDGYIKGQLVTKGPTEELEEDDELDFFEDPKRAVSRAIDSHPQVKEAALQAQQYKAQMALSTLKQKHPDMVNVLQDPNFTSWIQGSKIRSELYTRADQGYDVEAADELFSSYKERAQVVQKTQQVEQASRSQQVKAASTGGSTGAVANQSTGSRIYRRADLIKLMQDDPDRYEALSSEVLKAYAEGRVK